MDLHAKRLYLQNCNFPFCADVSKYEVLKKVGQGTFGEVFKARGKTGPDKYVALKRIIMEKEKGGFPITALREIRILQLMRHENVVRLIEMCKSNPTETNKFLSKFYIVFEFCDHDLAGLLSNANVKFNLGEIKKLAKQLLNAIYYIHSNKIVHRDIKSPNILITRKGVLKLADFGLARPFSTHNPDKKKNTYTNRVVTLWYRPPELLLGAKNYGPPIDIWGAGCVMAELWTRSAILQGDTEQHQLTLISQLCGSITTKEWPGVDQMNLYNTLYLIEGQKRKVKERLYHYIQDWQACDLIDKMLILDPKKRYNADQALEHNFFWTDPMPRSLEKMLSHHSYSMFEYHAPKRGAARHQRLRNFVPDNRKEPNAVESQFMERIF